MWIKYDESCLFWFIYNDERDNWATLFCIQNDLLAYRCPVRLVGSIRIEIKIIS